MAEKGFISNEPSSAKNFKLKTSGGISSSLSASSSSFVPMSVRNAGSIVGNANTQGGRSDTDGSMKKKGTTKSSSPFDAHSYVRGKGNGNRDGGNNNNDSTQRKKKTKNNPNTSKNNKDRKKDYASRNTTPNTNTKRNGEKGAAAFTVSEDHRIRFTKILLDMRENDTMDRIEMPSNLTNTERKFIHTLAMELGLKSKSSGSGGNRKISITKMDGGNSTSIAGISNSLYSKNDKYIPHIMDKYLPTLDIGPKGVQRLELHISLYPPSKMELQESHCTGSSLINAIANPHRTKLVDTYNEDDNAFSSSDGVLFGSTTTISVSKTNESPIMSTNEKEGDSDAGDEIVLLNALDNLNLTHKDNIKNNPRQSKNKFNIPNFNIKKRISFHRAAQEKKLAAKNYSKMLQSRKKLPAYSNAEYICHIICSNQITILSGDTGCGKSTQVPQFLLDNPEIGPRANIVVTQPRRISAISIAERVASERCEDVGKTVGYHVRLESASSKNTQLLFLTPGVLLRKFQSDPHLSEYTHVIIDEIHERDKYTEFLMVALRDLVKVRSDLKVILMSATIQTNELMQYWSSYSCNNLDTIDSTILSKDVQSSVLYKQSQQSILSKPAEINIPGRTFPVQEFFLEEVLAMTGFVDDDSYRFGSGVNAMKNFEVDLQKAFESQVKSNQNQQYHYTGNAKAKNISEIDLSLKCIMCNKSGFKCAEELGTHVAMCDGGGKCSMDELEDKVKAFNSKDSCGYDIAMSKTEENSTNSQENEHDIFDEYDDQEEFENEENKIGLSMGKWDGESQFGFSDVALSNKMVTLTDEEMLSRYQAIHDDEEVDDELILEVITYINKSSFGDGAILVFLPGWQEISEFSMLLEQTPPFSDKSKFSILPLHSGIPSRDQKKVFLRPPQNVRKIILATNIAETSVTIDDVAFVVDSGRAKEKNYDPHLKTSTLRPVWISQASARQRKGRAGRTKAGVCFHLFSQRRYESFRPFLESELLRTPLEEICLQCKKLNLAPGGLHDENGIPNFLSSALSPPHPKSVINAIELLVEIGAMDMDNNDLTQLGQCLAALSLEPKLGKMVIWSYILGCTKGAASMAIANSYKSPFVLPPPFLRNKADQAKVIISKGSESDPITILNALIVRDEFYKKGKKDMFYDYCKSNFINVSTIQMVADLRRNISRELTSLGFPDPLESKRTWHNCNGIRPAYLQAAVAAGLYPNIAHRTAGESNFSTMRNRKARIHISSVNSSKGQPLSGKCKAKKGEIEFVAYGEMVRGMACFTMSQTSRILSALPMILLCGELRVRPAQISDEIPTSSVLSVDDWILFLCSRESASALVVLRKRLNNIFMRMVSNPSQGLNSCTESEIDAVNTLHTVLLSCFYQQEQS